MAKLKTTIELELGQFKRELSEARKQLRDGTGDADALKKRIKELEDRCKSSATELAAVKKATEGARAGFTGLKDAIKGFDGSAAGFSNVMKSLGSAKEAFAALKTQSGGAGAALANLTGVSGGAGAAMSALVSPVGLAVAAVAGMGAVCVEAAVKFNDFKGSLNDLQALTGMSAEQMKTMQDGIIDVSNATGVAAEDIAKSMGVIGSQAPELLKVPDALLKVTEAANILAQAGGIMAEDAAKGITTIVNQMGVSAEEAGEIANTLAAAQQKGAAGVEYINKAIEKSGTQAKAAGMDYHELVAVIESIAPKFSSADVAGSQLNSTLLKLSMGADEFNPAVVGMQTALKNLSDAQLSNAELSKLVGESNITMVTALMQGVGVAAELREEITGTNAAYDQANIKTQGMNAAVDKLSLAWDNFLLTLGGSDAMQEVVEALSATINGIADAVIWCTKNTDYLVTAFKILNYPVVQIYNAIKDICDLIDRMLNGLRGVTQGAAALGVEAANNFIKKQAANTTAKTGKPAAERQKEEEAKTEEKKKPKVTQAKDYGKVLLEAERSARIAELNGIKDKDERERALLDERHRQKMEDLKSEYAAAVDWQQKLAIEYKATAERLNYKNESEKLGDGIVRAKMELVPLTTEDLKPAMVNVGNDGEINIKASIDIETAKENLEELGNAITQVGEVFTNIGEIVGNEGFSIAGVIAKCIASLLEGYASASAKAGGTMGPWGWAAFSIAGLAQVTSTIAQVKRLGKFANGGVIKAASSVGDMNLARVNAGEMILNQSQQGKLFRMINQPSAAAEEGSGRVEFKVRGSELVGVLENYNTFRR